MYVHACIHVCACVHSCMNVVDVWVIKRANACVAAGSYYDFHYQSVIIIFKICRCAFVCLWLTPISAIICQLHPLISSGHNFFSSLFIKILLFSLATLSACQVCCIYAYIVRETEITQRCILRSWLHIFVKFFKTLTAVSGTSIVNQNSTHQLHC